MNRLMWMAVVGSAAQAWPCNPDFCLKEGDFAHIDGGVPSNFWPLAITDFWNTSTLSHQSAELRQEDGGIIPSEVRILDSLTMGVETPRLVEGQRYHLMRWGGCAYSYDRPLSTYTHEFTVLPPMSLPTEGIDLQVTDAGSGPVHQDSGASCSEGVRSSFANFRFDVSPSLEPVLPFLIWNLSLQPITGGSGTEGRRNR